MRCEGLSAANCQTAYPVCRLITLESCCGGQGICVDINLIKMDQDECPIVGDEGETYCIQDPINDFIFEIKISNVSQFNFESYILFKPNAETCESLGCEMRSLGCEYLDFGACSSLSPCCQPTPVCVDNGIDIYTVNKPICDIDCPVNFTCRSFLGNIPQCLPITCDIVHCPESTYCREIPGVGVVSCFPIFLEESDAEESCETKRCPINFHCDEGAFTNADCIPDEVVFTGSRFNCSRCPSNWWCQPLGWDGLCVEWGNEIYECYDGLCHQFQKCDTTSRSCVYQPCDNKTCSDGLFCFQITENHPRMCASDIILPSQLELDTIKI
ncbi:hypothetical protein DLAC_06445 [Tieghemostelium lacteum]|uniref:DSCP-N domain-containing protein n=1 Tax=Tieghemostelium lacteum TaxID=361077 RepID=A0A151ZES8_TIELA|nr:hypothetical protein DLAC_06445 [Tieghemostelium lacteum]|eukprot:KYQ92463.1 hypothetical protein DLAC_06445 [Tieghemostelium lacteum]